MKTYYQMILIGLKGLEETPEAGSIDMRGLNLSAGLGSNEGKKAIMRTRTTLLRELAIRRPV
jgi:hypothetical protein